jgi:hypothetical protein
LEKYAAAALILDFAVEGMAAKMLIILLLLDAVRLLAFIAAGHVAGDGLPLSACFGAF